jgi:hypothetical protein
MKISSDKIFAPTINNVALIRKQPLSLFHFVLFLGIFYVVFFTSCANQGVGPGGGPKDSIPPVIVNCIPTPSQTQFAGKEIIITFNEYIVPDNLAEKLIISPPLGKKPTIKTAGKSIIVKMEEDLIPDRTYSFDFGDGVKDYTEGNKYESLRLVFSTGTRLDTLRISGHIFDATTLEPVPNALATLYSSDNDSLFKNLHPDFIARADDKGFFLFDNLPPEEYKLYALKDDDKNLYFSNVFELIAFTDSLLSPTVLYVEKIDTLITETDTIISTGYNEFFPKELNLLLFQDDHYSQYMVSFKRETNDRCLFIFNEPVTDSIKIELIGSDSLFKWNEIELSKNLDSLSLWITDSTFVKKDTLFFSVTYPATDDSTGILGVKTDTLRMTYSKPVQTAKQGKTKPAADDHYFTFSSNLSPTGFDLNNKILIEAQSPIDSLQNELFKLVEIKKDSTLTPLDFELEPIEGSSRKFILDFALKENTNYELSIDTAVVMSLSGIPNAGFSTKFSTQKKDFYGSIILTLSGIEKDGIIQLIKLEKEERVIKEVKYNPTMKTVVLDFLKPDKYLLKFIDDVNGNGKWDTGMFSEKRQPESVYYLQKEMTVKSNWEIKENWEIKKGTIQSKAFTKTADEKKKTGKQ